MGRESGGPRFRHVRRTSAFVPFPRQFRMPSTDLTLRTATLFRAVAGKMALLAEEFRERQAEAAKLDAGHCGQPEGVRP